MNLGVQYYRAPFPEERYWKDDFKRIKDSGLNTVQLWVLWAWVEPKPGRFIFDDYDRLVELAEQEGLGVVFSTIAEIQPYWIFREVPGSELVNHLGLKILSANRGECHFGLTPGGCTDHPEIWKRMEGFLNRVVSRYCRTGSLRGWDAWNELRWNVKADGLVCFCPHTLNAFHRWLEMKFGGLDGLNKAWRRRYGQWDEVMPGRFPVEPYTEMMAFERFLTWRANQHGKERYRVIKSLDPKHPVTLHGGETSPLSGGGETDHALNRGNDWFYADDLDGVGYSSFPAWGCMDNVKFAMRAEFMRSAAGDKQLWLSEVQGGQTGCGFNAFPQVDAFSQQRWLWTGIANGTRTIIFWCWRNEVFGSESSGFGIIGNDGFAEERIAAMKVTGVITAKYRDLFNNYKPLKPDVGVFFSPQTYYLNWAQERNSKRTVDALHGYCRALTHNSIPLRIIEEEHLNDLAGLKIIFLPHTLVMDETTETALAEFVKKGGLLVCESECGAFTPQGFYRYPEDRFLARLAGISEAGRRMPDKTSINLTIGNQNLKVGIKQWITPYRLKKGKVLASGKNKVLAAEIAIGKGKLVLCGSYPGEAYAEDQSSDFEKYVTALVRESGWKPDVEIVSPKPGKNSFVYVKAGTAGDKKLVFAFFPPECRKIRLRFNPALFTEAKQGLELFSGKTVKISKTGGKPECHLPANPRGMAVVLIG